MISVGVLNIKYVHFIFLIKNLKHIISFIYMYNCRSALDDFFTLNQTNPHPAPI